MKSTRERIRATKTYRVGRNFTAARMAADLDVYTPDLRGAISDMMSKGELVVHRKTKRATYYVNALVQKPAIHFRPNPAPPVWNEWAR